MFVAFAIDLVLDKPCTAMTFEDKGEMEM